MPVDSAPAPSAAPSLASLFPIGSVSSTPSPTKEEEKDHSPVPVTDKSNNNKKDASKEEPAKKKAPVKDKERDDTPDKDGKSELGDKKDKPAEKKPVIDAKDAENTDKKSDSTADGDEDEKDVSKVDPHEKRLKDTQAWANKINQEKLQLVAEHKKLQQQNDMLTKKLADPDYDPSQDPAYAGPTHEEVAATSLLAGKALASRDAAYRQHGKEKVDGVVSQFVNLFENNEAVQLAVRNSENPIHTAMEIVEDFHFRSVYGDRPNDIVKNIRTAAEADLRKSIRAEVIEEIREGKQMKEHSAKGLSEVRRGNGTDGSKTKGESGETPLGKIFTTIK